MATFKTLTEANRVRQKEWDKESKIDASYRGNEMAGEVGEACNVIKKLERERLGIAGSRDTVEHLGQELADVIICAHLVAMQYPEINLDREVALKFNATSEKIGLETRMEVPEEYVCSSCGSKSEIESIQSRGFISCCPERKMVKI